VNLRCFTKVFLCDLRGRFFAYFAVKDLFTAKIAKKCRKDRKANLQR